MDNFKFLPVEITVDILTRLPAEWVLVCKLTSKTWNNLVSHHPSFSKMHLDHLNHLSNDSGKLGFLALTSYMSNNPKFYYFEYNENHDESEAPTERIRRVKLTSPFKDCSFVGSSNGLICLAEDPFVYICNPITRESVMLPEIKRNSDIDHGYRYVATNFGYVSSINEYKVVQVYVSRNNTEEVQVVELHIYTLGSGTGWRNIGKFNVGMNLHEQQNVFFANEALHWMDKDMIVTFDLAEEKFCEDLPPLPPASHWCLNKIGVMDGILFFANHGYYNFSDAFDIWLLRRKNGNHDIKVPDERQTLVWSRELWVNGDELLAFTKRDGVLTYDYSYLKIQDTKTSTSKRLVKFKDYIFRVSPHKNTLVSLKELGEEDTTTMPSIDIKDTKCGIQLLGDEIPDYIYL